MSVHITDQPFDPWRTLAEHESQANYRRAAAGASAVFVGTMRDFNDGADVTTMTLDHYPGMTDKHLNEIEADVRQRFELLDTLIVHRVGDLSPGDPIVLVAAWSAHRAEAFEASRALMEDLKSRAPFWKKEQGAEGARWVARNTPGTVAARVAAADKGSSS